MTECSINCSFFLHPSHFQLTVQKWKVCDLHWENKNWIPFSLTKSHPLGTPDKVLTMQFTASKKKFSCWTHWLILPECNQDVYIVWNQWTHATVHDTLNRRRNSYICDNLLSIEMKLKQQRELLGMEWTKQQNKAWSLHHLNMKITLKESFRCVRCLSTIRNKWKVKNIHGLELLKIWF